MAAVASLNALTFAPIGPRRMSRSKVLPPKTFLGNGGGVMPAFFASFSSWAHCFATLSLPAVGLEHISATHGTATRVGTATRWHGRAAGRQSCGTVELRHGRAAER